MLPVLYFGGRFLWSLVSVKAGLGLLAVSLPAGLYLDNIKMKKAIRLGLNPEYDKYRKKKVQEMTKKGLPPMGMGGDVDVVSIELYPEDVPPRRRFLCDHNPWVLPKYLAISFLDMVRKESIYSHEGAIGVKFRVFEKKLKKAGIELKEYRELALHGPAIDYEQALWYSNNWKEELEKLKKKPTTSR